MGRDDVKDLGITRPGTVAMVVNGIKKLQEQEEEDYTPFIQHSSYCMGKILDHIRMKAMKDLGVPNPQPNVREAEKERFQRIVEFYFPTEESASGFLA